MLAKNEQYIRLQNLLIGLRSSKRKQLRKAVGQWRDMESPVCFIGLAFNIAMLEGVDLLAIAKTPCGVFIEQYYNIPEKLTAQCIQANDAGYTFNQIADLIETSLNLPTTNLEKEPSNA